MLNYFHQPDEAGFLASGPPEDTGDWIAAIQKCFASVAIAAALGANALATDVASTVYVQDEVTQTQPWRAEEDFWSNPVAPVLATFYQQLPLLEASEIIPAVAPSFQPDEDLWFGPSGALQLDQKIPAPWTFGGDDAGSLLGQPDEEFWQNPVAPVSSAFYQPLPYLFDAAEIVTQPAGQPDEDSWANPTPPVCSSNIRPNPWTFDIQEAAGSMFGQADEDQWQNSVRPTQASLYQPLPYLFDTPELFPVVAPGEPDEDYWVNPSAPLYASNIWPQPWSYDVQETAGSVSAHPDEDYWQVPMWQAVASQVRLFSDDEVLFPPAASVRDEDYWVNAVAPTRFTFLPLINFDGGEIAFLPIGPQTIASLGAAVRPAIDSLGAIARPAIDSQSAAVRPAIDSFGAAVRPS